MNNPFGISDRSYTILKSFLARFPEIESVRIFGSRAKGNFKPGSDIDLAIMGKGCSSYLALDLSAKINEELPVPYEVDVVDYGSIENPELRNHIDRVGKAF